jgi:hypothetical protein
VAPLNALSSKVLHDGRTVADKIQFVHVYVVEAHPAWPDPSPFYGRVWELEFSEIPQTRSYEERMAAAGRMRPLIDERQLLLVDSFGGDDETAANPVWCTYGPSPNSAYLIRQDGIIEVAQEWAFTDSLEAAVLRFLGEK